MRLTIRIERSARRELRNAVNKDRSGGAHEDDVKFELWLLPDAVGYAGRMACDNDASGEAIRQVVANI